MPRSSRHKSSKHSTRDSREHSDSEKESSLKEKKGRHSKDISSGEKRKLDLKHAGVSKDLVDLSNAELNDEFETSVLSLSKKRKEKVDEDRWTGGEENYEHEMLKSKMKEKEKEVRRSGDAKRSSRKEVSYVSGFDIEEGKKSGSKGESKHHRSERKERGSEREKKGSRSDRSERLVDIVSVSENTGSERNRKQSGSGEERGGKHGVGNTDCNLQEVLTNPELERDIDKRVGRKRVGCGDGDRHRDVVRDPDDRGHSSREEIAKSVKHKDDAHKDERNRDRFQEDIHKDSWRQDDKKRDNQSTRDYTVGKSEDKHLRNNKKDSDVSHKLSKTHGGESDKESDRDRKRYHDHVRDRDRDREHSRVDVDRDRKHDDREHDLDRDRDRDRDRDQERAHDRDREVDRDRERGRDRYRRELRDRLGVRDHERGRERDFDHDLHVNEKDSRFKEDRGRRRSTDNYDYHGDKLKIVDTEVGKERSLSRKPNVDSVTSSCQNRASPSSRSFGGADKYRDGIQDEIKYGDSLRDSTVPGAVEKAPKYQSGEKRAKFDDNLIGEFSERSPNNKVSPAGVKERSPSSTSFDHSRFSSRNTRRKSLDVDDAERCSSIDIRDVGVTKDRQGRDLCSKNYLGDEYPSAASPFYHKSGQGNFSSHGPSPGPGRSPSFFRNRADSPSFVGSFGEDSRGSGNRYRRSVDPNVGRGPGNAWNGVPNWPSPLPNGFMPFPPGPLGPHHGGFPPVISQFPPLFGIRPTLDMNHQGMPYHLADGDRFPGHVRPIGWPNMVEGSLPHFQGWDAGNGMLRNDSSVYGPGHLAQRRDMNLDYWKPNGDMNMDVISGSQKDGPTMKASTDEVSSAQGASKPNVESSCFDDQATSFKDALSGLSPMKEIPSTPAKGTTDKTPESCSVYDTAQLTRAYFVKLDISMDLADPELYDHFSLAFKGGSEYVEDDMDPDFMEEKADVESEITNLAVDLKIFPVAEESIFQKAMNIYKTQISERKIFVVPEADKIRSRSHSQPESDPTLLLEKVDSPPDFSIKQEEQSLTCPLEIVPATVNGEEEKSVSMTGDEVLNKSVLMTGDEVLNGGPLQNSDFTLDVGDETQMPVLKTEEDSLEFITGNVDNGDLCVEITNLDSIVSNADNDIVVDGGTIVSSDSILGDQLDAAVSSPLILCNDSVNVCEALITVSNESESVVLSRIHHSPESTH